MNPAVPGESGTNRGRYDDWSLAISVQPTFDAIAAATVGLDPAHRH
ncbi:MAG: hypothetical protein JO281_00755 [Pseudonocardiales bacterium]|nr:hypothetical protein [Pseudonocardiales bacterium]